MCEDPDIRDDHLLPNITVNGRETTTDAIQTGYCIAGITSLVRLLGNTLTERPSSVEGMIVEVIIPARP